MSTLKPGNWEMVVAVYCLTAAIGTLGTLGTIGTFGTIGTIGTFYLMCSDVYISVATILISLTEWKRRIPSQVNTELDRT